MKGETVLSWRNTPIPHLPAEGEDREAPLRLASTRNILISVSVLVAAILFFGLSDADLWVQSQFYDPQTRQWIVDSNDVILKFLFYDGIKRLLIVIGVVLLLGSVVLWKRPFFAPYRRAMVIVLLSSVLVPVVIGSLKAVTNMPCPKNLEIFGGTYPHTCVWEEYPSQMCRVEKQKCWPAGHASGGFALMSLIYLFRSRKARIGAVFLAVAIGWSMGSYKMLIGDHFLSHTAITMIVAWLMILLIELLVDFVRNRRTIQEN